MIESFPDALLTAPDPATTKAATADAAVLLPASLAVAAAWEMLADDVANDKRTDTRSRNMQKRVLIF